ncbi:uncharacterized protein BYT42DRAFT_565721, partial [Radiomyces spectabilis]|uniref:uncharacterized protein n=1 Tax=Radiomyces spectabilis TaxID=64574 RepID=UPI0022200B8E
MTVRYARVLTLIYQSFIKSLAQVMPYALGFCLTNVAQCKGVTSSSRWHPLHSGCTAC